MSRQPEAGLTARAIGDHVVPFLRIHWWALASLLSGHGETADWSAPLLGPSTFGGWCGLADPRRVLMRDPGSAGDDLAAAEAHYRRLLDRSLVPICIHDGDTVRYVNTPAVRALGATDSTDIVGRSLTDFVHPLSLAAVTSTLAALREDGDSTAPARYSLLRVDGTELVVQAVAALRMEAGTAVYEVIFREPLPVRLGADRVRVNKPTEAIIATTVDGIVTEWNADAHDLYGRSAQEVVGTPIERAVGAGLDPRELSAVNGRAIATHFDADGAPLRVRVLAIRTNDGYVVVCDTVADAGPGDERLHDVLDLLHDGVIIVGNDGRFQFANAAARQILGQGAEALVGTHHSSHADAVSMYDARGRRIAAESQPLRSILDTGLSVRGQVIGIDRRDGTRVWVTWHGCLVTPDDPENSSVLMSFTDITEHHDARERLLHEATHDWLTGLPNRGYALDQAATGLTRTGADRLSAVLFIDLDRLKAVNDGHGHTIGDEVLRRAAHRMRSATRAQDLVARIGGDEFVVLLTGPLGDGDLDRIAERLHRVLDEDIVVGPLTLQIGASIGITVVDPADDRSLSEVLRDADIAMYRAKAQGRAATAYFEDAESGPPNRGQ